MKKNKVAILTWHYYKNFGSALQAYALQESIKGLGYNVKIIDYRNPKFGQVNRFKDNLKISINKIFGKTTLLGKRFNTSYSSFYSKYFQQTKLIQDSKLLLDACKQFDAIVCGSDQIWAPNVFNPTYMLDFVPDNKKKISYAASIGLNEIPDELVPKYSELLSKFDAISVRESVGAKLLEENCNISADVVLDPTLLISVKKWNIIEKKPFKTGDEKYVFCYFLNSEHGYRECVKNFAHKKRYKIIGFSAKKSDKEWMDTTLSDIGPQEFLWLIHNAEAIITDSYHGTAFSLLYHKNFITLERFLSDDKICQNSRIYQLKSYFGLENMIIKPTPTTELNLFGIDYDKFDIKLSELREYSLEFLRKALEE